MTRKESKISSRWSRGQVIEKLTELGLRKKVVLEASGQINSKNIIKYAETNIDMISIVSITNSVDGVDLSLEIS